MSSLRTLARPYARAAFELARDANSLPSWSSGLQNAAALVSHSSSSEWVKDPRIDTDSRVRLFLPEGEATDGPLARFLRLLAENDRLELLPEITDLFAKLHAEAERILDVRVRSAGPIDEVQQQMLTGALAKRFDRAIRLQVELDPELIGGAVIDTGDLVIDGSLRSRLARLKAELQS